MAPPAASPSGHRDGLRSASRAHGHEATGNESAMTSLRAAIKDIYERFDAYTGRSRQLQSESDKALREYAAETAGLLQRWSTEANFRATHVELQLQSRNAQQKMMENEAADRQARNRTSFYGELDSILKDIVAKDRFILETNDDANDKMSVDESQVQAHPVTRKRAREADSPRVVAPPESPSLKRPRRASSARRAPEGGQTSANGKKPDNGMDGRTITFDEVYQGGKAKHKHAIVTHASVPGKWLILKCECDDHTVHFGSPKSALQGAAKHLDTMYHKIKRSYEGAVKHLGWEVLGCDPDKVASNNATFEEALSQGYVPVNNRRSGRKSLGGFAPEKPAVEEETSGNSRITRAKGGELYYAWWPDDEKYYLCMIIPWDTTRDFGLKEMRKGIHGLGLLDKKLTSLPKCYTIDCDLEPPQITGWSEGYEDGGPKESKRVFPTLFFHPPKNLAAWTKASFLRPFDWRRPNFDAPGHKLKAQSVSDALEAMAKAQGFSCYADFEAAHGGAASGMGQAPVEAALAPEAKDNMEVDSAESYGSGSDKGQVDENPGERTTADVSTPGGDTDGPSTLGGGIVEETRASVPPTMAAESAAPRGPTVQDKIPADAPANDAAVTTTASPAPTTTTQPAQSGAPAASSATTDAKQQAQNGVLPNRGKPLFARRSQSGTRVPTTAATPPITPTDAESGSAADLPPRPSSVETPDVRSQESTKVNATNEPPRQSAKLNTPAMAAASLKATGWTQSPTMTTLGQVPPSANQRPKGSPKGSSKMKNSEVRLQQNVKNTARTRSLAATAAQTLPPQSQPTQKVPQSATAATTIQTPTGLSGRPGLSKGSPAALPASSHASSPTPRNAAITEPSRYYLSEYEGPDTFWQGVNDSERLVLEVDPGKEMALTGSWQPVTVEIARKMVTSHKQFRNRPGPGQHTLTLDMRDKASGAVQEHRLVFDAHAGKAASLHARAFFSWVSGW